jgi:hypothetical protein
MAPDGSQTIMLPPNVAGQPSHALHAGHRWFLQHREVPGDPYPNQEPRREIFAVRGDGDERFTVQLTDQPDQNPVRHPRWFRDPHTGAVDGRISWGTHLWDRTTTNRTLAILAARLQFNGAGQVIGLTDLSEEPLVTGAIDHDWSPDGTRLVYSQNRELRIRDIATGQDTALATGREPAWSPDGQWIVFLSENQSIQLIRPDGSDLQTLVLKPEYPGVITLYPMHHQPLWSPDSQYVLYFRHDATLGRHIYRIPALGGDPVNLTREIGSGFPVAWRVDLN